jgi:hypothetical protein
MSNQPDQVLDLDELFGQARAVKVKYGGREHELLRLEAMGPLEVVKFKKMYAQANELQMASIQDDMTEDQAKAIVSMFDEMLQMICKTLPIPDMAFAVKARVLEFYVIETQGKKKEIETLQKVRTGAKRSAS